MELSLGVDDFCWVEVSGLEVVCTTETSSTTTEGGILSPVIRFLFGSWVETKVTTTIRSVDTIPSLSDSLLEAELQQLVSQ